MVESVILLGILDGHHVLNVFHHTDRCLVATGITTDGAHVAVADVVADAAVFHLLLHAGYGVGKLLHVVCILTKQVQHQSQGRLAAYAWQFAELLYSLLQQL